MDKKESFKEMREQTETEVDKKDETVKKARPGKRRFGSQQGPLWWLEGLHIDGYYLYFCNDRMPNDPFYIQQLLNPEVGYSYVHPSEVGLSEIEGFKLNDKVSMPVGGGITGYLLKQPIEWHEEDMKAEIKPVHDEIYKGFNKQSSNKLSRVPR